MREKRNLPTCQRLRQEGPKGFAQIHRIHRATHIPDEIWQVMLFIRGLILVHVLKQRRPHPLTSIPIRQCTSPQTRYIYFLLNQPFAQPKFKTSQVYIFLKHPAVQQGLPWSHYIQLYHNPKMQYPRNLSNQLNTLNPAAILRFQVEGDLSV